MNNSSFQLVQFLVCNFFNFEIENMGTKVKKYNYLTMKSFKNNIMLLVIAIGANLIKGRDKITNGIYTLLL